MQHKYIQVQLGKDFHISARKKSMECKEVEEKNIFFCEEPWESWEGCDYSSTVEVWGC